MDEGARIVELALEAGFDLAGIAPLRPPRAAGRFEAWLAAGHHAGMSWLERDRGRITDPRRVLPEGRSLLVVGMGFARPAVALPAGARVARYAAGRDYHNRMGKLLAKLARRLVGLGLSGSTRAIVDAGPLLERSHAAEAGLGFESKAANLLHPRLGPWFFLGELLVDRELEPTPTPPAGSCGTCTACLDACPTAAIREPGVVDARLCISYHTIENRGPVPHALRPAVRDWAFGCDVCSEVCPWGLRAPDASAGFGTHAAVAGRDLLDWLRVGEEAFGELFRGSPLQRARRAGLARNAALALSASPSDAGREGLLEALGDPEALVREAAFWSLSQAHGSERGVARALERALGGESDPEALRGMHRTREGSPD